MNPLDPANANPEPIQVTEKELLLQQCRTMGITVSNNASVETIKKKIEDHLASIDGTEKPAAAAQANPLAPAPVKGETLRQRLIREKMKLVRVRIQNMNPAKKALNGEIFTVANGILGTVRHFVPFGEVTENGWHLPLCIVENLKRREFVNITTSKDRRTGAVSVKTAMAKEFAIEILPDLTTEELALLAKSQIAAGTSNVGAV